MQTEMLFGESPDFDTLMDQLRELNGNLVMHGQEKSLPEVIGRGKGLVKDLDGNELQIEIVFEANPTQSTGSANSVRRYEVQSIKRKNTIIFHRIRITYE